MFLYIDYRLVKYLIITLVEYLVEKSLKKVKVFEEDHTTRNVRLLDIYFVWNVIQYMISSKYFFSWNINLFPDISDIERGLQKPFLSEHQPELILHSGSNFLLMKNPYL